MGGWAGGRAGRQAKCFQFTNFLKFDNFNSKARYTLFEWTYGANSFVRIDKPAVFERNIIVRLVFQMWEAIYFM